MSEAYGKEPGLELQGHACFHGLELIDGNPFLPCLYVRRELEHETQARVPVLRVGFAPAFRLLAWWLRRARERAEREAQDAVRKAERNVLRA